MRCEFKYNGLKLKFTSYRINIIQQTNFAILWKDIPNTESKLLL